MTQTESMKQVRKSNDLRRRRVSRRLNQVYSWCRTWLDGLAHGSWQTTITLCNFRLVWPKL